MGKMTNRNARTGKLPILLIALTVLAAFQPALAETQDVEETRKKAERGHDRAQYKLGVMYATGEGVPEDHREAVKWFRKAAEQGNPRRNSTWASCTTEGRECQRTTGRR